MIGETWGMSSFLIHLPTFEYDAIPSYQFTLIELALTTTHSDLHLSKILARRNRHIRGEGIKKFIKRKNSWLISREECECVTSGGGASEPSIPNALR